MRKTWSFFIQCAIIVLCSFCILQSDRFQMFFSPQKFWEKRCVELRSLVKCDESKVKSLVLSLDREKILLEHDLSHVQDLAFVMGKEENEVREKIMADGERKMTDLQKEIELFSVKKEKREKSLEEALKHHS